MAATGIKFVFEELKRRRVFRVAILYGVVFWPIIQVVDILSPALNLSDAVMRYLVTAFLGGVPFALILAWIFDADRDGIHPDDGEQRAPLLGSKSEMSLVGILAVVVAILFVVQSQLDDDSVSMLVNPSAIKLPDSQTASIAQDSIAVLPFVTFSDRPEDQYFADGLTEELLNVLSRIQSLKVAARTSSFAYKDVNRKVQDVGRELGVAKILEGSVRRNDVDNTIRVTAQLIDVKSGSHLWSKTFDRQFRDVFKIQDEISATVARQLHGSLATGIPAVDRSIDANPEALIAYGMGQKELARRTRTGLEAAARHFQRAIDLDQNYALAYSGLADAYSLQVNYGFLEKEMALQLAEQAIEQALAIDPDLGIAWASKGLALDKQGKADEARVAFRKAMRLNPSYAMAYMWYASLLDDKDKKLEFYKKALVLDPRSAVAAYNVASLYDIKGMETEAMQMVSQIVEADPYYPGAYRLMAKVDWRRGRIGEAIRNLTTGYDLQEDPQVAVELSTLYAELGNFVASDEWFGKRGDISPAYQTPVDWGRLGRFVAANDAAATQQILEGIAARPVSDWQSRVHRVLAYYYMRDYSKALSQFENLPTPEMDHSTHFLKQLNQQVTTAGADMLIKAGRRQEARKLAEQELNIVDTNIENVAAVDPANHYQKARLLTILGENQRAIYSLQRAVDEGWRARWVMTYDPVFNEIKDSRSFKNLVASMDLRMAVIRDQFLMEAEFAATTGV